MPNPICPECFSTHHRNGCPDDPSPEWCNDHEMPLNDCTGCVAHAAAVIDTEPLFHIVADFHEEFVHWVVEESKGDPDRAAHLHRAIQMNPYLVIREWRMAYGPPFSNEIATCVAHICRRCDAFDHEEWRYGEKASRPEFITDTSGPLCDRCEAEAAACYEKAGVA